MQNETFRVILGTTKITPIETSRFKLDLPPMQTRQKVEQVKAYFSAVENPHNPPHEAVKDTRGCRLGRGKSRMDQAEDSVRQVRQLTELKQTKEWERYSNRFRRLYETLLPENLGKHYRKWPAGKTESSVSLRKTANRKTSSCTLMAQSQKTRPHKRTRPHNNGTDKSAKAGQSAERGDASHTGDHQEHTH